MPSLSEYRTKIKSVQSTQQITKTLKMIAGVRLARAQKQVQDSAYYSTGLQQLLFGLATPQFISDHAESPEAGAWLRFFEAYGPARGEPAVNMGLLVITSDKGLCGGFNTVILRRAMDTLRCLKAGRVSLFLLGRKAQEHFRRLGMIAEKEYSLAGFPSVNAAAAAIAADIAGWYARNGRAQVDVICNEFKSVIKQQVVQRRLLPIAAPDAQPGAGAAKILFEPQADELVRNLLPQYVQSQVFRAVQESLSAECAARMNAMDNASKNAQELIESFTLTMNKMRQGIITRELTEIVGTSEALK